MILPVHPSPRQFPLRGNPVGVVRPQRRRRPFGPRRNPAPLCLGGERACPPEDCGGVYGYYKMLEALQDSGHESYADYVEWIGEDFNPDAFHVDAANKKLKAHWR